MSKPRKERITTRLTPASLILASGIPGEAEEHKFLSVKFQGHPFIRPRALISEESGMITFEIVEVTKKSRRRLSQRCEFSLLKRDVLSLIAFEGDKIPEVLIQRKRKEKDVDLADTGRRKVKVEKNDDDDEEEMEEVIEENPEPENMTSDQLRQELQKRGLEHRGLKAELIRRLKEALSEENGEPRNSDIVLQTVNSSALFVHVDSEDEAQEDEADQQENRSNYGDDDEEEPVYDEDQPEDEQDRRHEEDGRSEKEDIFEGNEDSQNEDGQQDQRENEHSEEDYMDEPEKEYSDEDRNQYNDEDRDREDSEEHDEEEVEGGRGEAEERLVEEDEQQGLNNKDKEPMETDEVEEDSPWDEDDEPIRRRSSPKKHSSPKKASPKKMMDTDEPSEQQSLGVDEHELQARESSDHGQDAQNYEHDMGEAPEDAADETEDNAGVYKEDVGLKNGKSMVQQLMEMNKNADEQHKESAEKTGDSEPAEKEAEKKSSTEGKNAEAPPAEPETFETTSYRVVIVTKRGARIIRRADSLLSRDKLERSRIIILEFALTSQNSTPKKAFSTLMDGPYEETANADIWPEKGPLSFKHTLTKILSEMLVARGKEKRASNAEAIFEENQELKKKNRNYEVKLEDLTSEMERLKKKISRAKETLG